MAEKKTKQPNGSDIFADIATSLHATERAGVSRPPLTHLSDRKLPLQDGAGLLGNRPRAPRVATAEDLNDALKQQHNWAAPYLRDLAPALQSKRSTLNFEVCDWREASDADLSDLSSAMRGEGSWTRVTIPHYGPPLGKATTLYRVTFDLDSGSSLGDSPVISLCFGAVDYICKPYLNGVCLGVHEGIFEPFEFEITRILKKRDNVLLILVENDFPMMGETNPAGRVDGDKVYAATGLGYDDPELGWHHCPPGMGIWQPFYLEGRSDMIVSDLSVDPSESFTEITVNTTIKSFRENHSETANLLISVYGQNFEATLIEDFLFEPTTQEEAGFGDLDKELQASTALLMGPGENYLACRLPIQNPKLWSPSAPNLYQVQVKLVDEAGNVLDVARQQFGLRSFVQDESSEPKGKFYLNGNEIRLRGANTMGNLDMCVFRGDTEQLIDDILLARLTNMNFLRLTQHPVQKEVYEHCDRLGMMLQTDLPLFASVRKNQLYECVRQAGAMERLVRPYASNILVSFINEPFPNGHGRPHRFLTRDQLSLFLKMAADAVHFENPKRVIKPVDGDYDPPAPYGLPDNHCYCGWYIGHGIDLGKVHAGHWLPVKEGWHYGCGEFGSEGLDSYAVMQANYPEEWGLGKIDEAWDPGSVPKAQTKNFHYLWYATPETTAEWIEESQKHQEWSNRIMAQAFRLMDGMNTFAIHLFIDAWPAGWMKTIMDVNRTPKKSWFSYRHALAPLAVFLRSDRTAGFAGETLPIELWVANDEDRVLENLKLHYEVSCEGAVLASGLSDAQVAACQPSSQGSLELTLPKLKKRATVEVAVALVDADGHALHDSLLEVEAFPRAETRAEAPTKIFILGDAATAADNFLQAFAGRLEQVDQLAQAQTVLVLGSGALERENPQLEAAVRAGATVCILGLTPGEYHLGAAPVHVRKAGMGPRHFVSCRTGHPLVEGFEENDFKFWFDERAGWVSPILETVLEAPEWATVLSTGDGGWGRPWGAVPAVIERAEGSGRWFVCQIDLLSRVHTNPAAQLFAEKMVCFHQAPVLANAAP